jgi:Tol biopolymer transport system component
LSAAIGIKLGSDEILSPIGVGATGEVYRARDMKLKRDVALKVLPQAFASDPGPMPESLPHVKIPWVIASIVAVALAAVSCGHFLKAPPPVPQLIQTTIDAPPKTRITNFAISPDGRFVAMIMTKTGERGAQLWVRPLESLQAQALAGTEGASLPFWSPDSRFIGFFAGGKLKKISAAGGPVQILCDAFASGGTWNSEGDIVFGAYPGLSRVSAMGSVPTKVIEVEWPILFPTFLPDGRRFLYLDLSLEPGVYLGSLDARPSSRGRRIIDDVSNAQYLPPSGGRPHGYILFAREQALMAQPVDPDSLQAAGDAFPIIEQVYTLAGTDFYDYSISRNAILLHRTGLGGLSQYAMFDRSGKQLFAVGNPLITPGRVALSPDEKRMVSERGVGTKINLWITDLERGATSRLTLNASENITPVWSPDGKDVAFASIHGGSYDLYRKTANPAGQDELLLRSETRKIPTDWCCDGRFIIFTQSSLGTLYDVFALPVSGDKKPIPLLHSEFNETAGTVSRDGRWLAYLSNESGRFEVYVQPFALSSSEPPGGKWQISIGGGRDPHWRGDGRELFYIAPNRNLMAVAVKTDGEGFVRSTPQPLFEVRFFAQSTTISRYAVSGDGKRFLMAADPETSSETPPLHVTVNWLKGLKR